MDMPIFTPMDGQATPHELSCAVDLSAQEQPEESMEVDSEPPPSKDTLGDDHMGSELSSELSSMPPPGDDETASEKTAASTVQGNRSPSGSPIAGMEYTDMTGDVPPRSFSPPVQTLDGPEVTTPGAIHEEEKRGDADSEEEGREGEAAGTGEECTEKDVTEAGVLDKKEGEVVKEGVDEVAATGREKDVAHRAGQGSDHTEESGRGLDQIKGSAQSQDDTGPGHGNNASPQRHGSTDDQSPPRVADADGTRPQTALEQNSTEGDLQEQAQSPTNQIAPASAIPPITDTTSPRAEVSAAALDSGQIEVDLLVHAEAEDLSVFSSEAAEADQLRALGSSGGRKGSGVGNKHASKSGGTSASSLGGGARRGSLSSRGDTPGSRSPPPGGARESKRLRDEKVEVSGRVWWVWPAEFTSVLPHLRFTLNHFPSRGGGYPLTPLPVVQAERGVWWRTLVRGSGGVAVNVAPVAPPLQSALMY